MPHDVLSVERRAEAYGLDALMPKARRAPAMPNQTPTWVVEELLAEAVVRPTLGAARYADVMLAERGFEISRSGVQKLLNRHGLGRRHQRVAALAQLTAATTGLVTQDTRGSVDRTHVRRDSKPRGGGELLQRRFDATSKCRSGVARFGRFFGDLGGSSGRVPSLGTADRMAGANLPGGTSRRGSDVNPAPSTTRCRSSSVSRVPPAR